MVAIRGATVIGRAVKPYSLPFSTKIAPIWRQWYSSSHVFTNFESTNLQIYFTKYSLYGFSIEIKIDNKWRYNRLLEQKTTCSPVEYLNTFIFIIVRNCLFVVIDRLLGLHMYKKRKI